MNNYPPGKDSQTDAVTGKKAFIPKKTAIVLLAVLLILIIPGLYLLSRTGKIQPPLQKPKPASKPDGSLTSAVTKKIYPFDVKPFEQGYRIGNVGIYLDDLDYNFGLVYRDTQENRKNKDNWKVIADKVTKDAILQNEIMKQKDISPGPARLDYKLVSEGKTEVEKRNVGRISFEGITIFFNNYLGPEVENPKIGIEKAKLKAYQILTDIRPRIVNGELTMKQAGDLLKNMDLSDIDISYKVNAYEQYNNITPNDVVMDRQIFDQLWLMNKDEISDIYLSKNDKTEYYYTIIKISDISKTSYNSLDQWLEQKKQGQAVSL